MILEISIVILVIGIICYFKFKKTKEKKLPALIDDYNYTSDELELIDLINIYRVSLKKTKLDIINHVSNKCEEHNMYMIAKQKASHDNFSARSENIIALFKAKKVGENIAYNFSTPNSALNAWLNSQSHKLNLEGDYTHMGLSITLDPINKKNYYTNIFLKI